MLEKRKTSVAGKSRGPITRRQFIAGAGAATLSFTVIKPELVRGFNTNAKIKLGMIGCGGRGTWIAELFRQHGGYNVVAGRKFRPFGTCYDHFALLFQYPNPRFHGGKLAPAEAGVGITFSSRQSEGHGTQPDGIRNRMFGSEGVLETKYGGQVIIRGENFYRGGKSPNIFPEGAISNIKTFHQSIIEGKFDNPTVAPSVRSNLVTILGRTAAYEGRKVTWDEIVNSKEKLDANLKGLRS